MREYIWYLPFWVWVTSLNMMFSGSHLPTNVKLSLFFFCCVVLHCVNVPHFPYPLFGRRTFRLFPGSGYDKQCCYEHSWAHALGYILKSGITGFWGRLFPNFLRTHQTDIRRGWTSLPSHQQCRGVKAAILIQALRLLLSLSLLQQL